MVASKWYFIRMIWLFTGKMDACVCSNHLNNLTCIWVYQILGLRRPVVLVYIKSYKTLNKTIPFQFFLIFVLIISWINYIERICFNVTSYKSFINKVYDLVGQPSYINHYSTLISLSFQHVQLTPCVLNCLDSPRLISCRCS